MLGCAYTETSKTNNPADPKNPIEAISKALGSLKF